jgi:hypothetical protein
LALDKRTAAYGADKTTASEPPLSGGARRSSRRSTRPPQRASCNGSDGMDSNSMVAEMKPRGDKLAALLHAGTPRPRPSGSRRVLSVSVSAVIRSSS